MDARFDLDGLARDRTLIALAQGLIAKYPEQEKVLTKGLALAQDHDAVDIISGEKAYVRSQHETGRFYLVTPGACSCAAYKKCAHRWAASLTMLAQREAPAVTAAPPDPQSPSSGFYAHYVDESGVTHEGRAALTRTGEWLFEYADSDAIALCGLDRLTLGGHIATHQA